MKSLFTGWTPGSLTILGLTLALLALQLVKVIT